MDGVHLGQTAQVGPLLGSSLDMMKDVSLTRGQSDEGPSYSDERRKDDVHDLVKVCQDWIVLEDDHLRL